MKPAGFLLFPQELVTDSYPELYESSPYSYVLFI
jgi:hypothetical protein